MKKLTLLFSLLLWLGFSQAAIAQATLLVVANIDYDLQLSKQQIRNLFLGGNLDVNLEAVSLPPSNQARVLFNTKVIGLTEARIQSYWAQMRFSGRKKEPKQFANEASLIEYMRQNKNTVAYLSADEPVPEGLKVVYSEN